MATAVRTHISLLRGYVLRTWASDLDLQHESLRSLELGMIDERSCGFDVDGDAAALGHGALRFVLVLIFCTLMFFEDELGIEE